MSLVHYPKNVVVLEHRKTKFRWAGIMLGNIKIVLKRADQSITQSLTSVPDLYFNRRESLIDTNASISDLLKAVHLYDKKRFASRSTAKRLLLLLKRLLYLVYKFVKKLALKIIFMIAIVRDKIFGDSK